MNTIKIPRKAKEVLKQDQVMRQLIEEITLKIPPTRGGVYEDLIEAIVYQQISIKAAKSIFDKFCGYFGGVIPQKEELVTIEVSELRTLGLSNQKAMYVRNIAAFFIEKQLSNEQLLAMADEEIIKLLTEIKGVGVWTVQMILIFSMMRPNVFPVKDYGIQTAIQELYKINAETPREMTRQMEGLANAWEPFQTYGTLLLWGWKRKQMGL